MHPCMYVCIMYVCMHARKYIYVCMYVCVYVRVCMCVCTQVNMYMYVRMYVCVYVCMYICKIYSLQTKVQSGYIIISEEGIIYCCRFYPIYYYKLKRNTKFMIVKQLDV